ncbi:oxidoreductase FAD-NAD-binding subunit protein, partial [Marine Group I thaumarchaeote SCGC AAA799-P11]
SFASSSPSSVLYVRGFVTEHDKREDGSFEVKYESYG